jgi:hypothetical protein
MAGMGSYLGGGNVVGVLENFVGVSLGEWRLAFPVKQENAPIQPWRLCATAHSSTACAVAPVHAAFIFP